MKLASYRISAVLILFTLLATSAMAQPTIPQLMMLNSQQTLLDTQLSSVKPTLFMPIAQSSFGMVIYAGFNQQLNLANNHIHNSTHYGVGIHQQLNPQIYSQLVFQEGHMANDFSGQQGVSINLGVNF